LDKVNKHLNIVETSEQASNSRFKLTFISGPTYAEKLLEASKTVYRFAKNHRGKYTDCISVAVDSYRYIYIDCSIFSPGIGSLNSIRMLPLCWVLGFGFSFST